MTSRTGSPGLILIVILIGILVIVTAALPSARASARITPLTQAATTSTTAQSRFPPGPGRDALLKVCSGCHGPESVLGQLKTGEEWNKTLDEMAAYGAEGSDAEWRQILEYLTKHFSLISINQATAKELESSLDIPPEIAAAIVRIRTEKGAFKTIDDLKRVPGIDRAKIDAQKDRLIFSVS